MLLQLRSLSFSTAGWLLSSSRCCWLLKVQVLNCKETEVAAAATYYNFMLYLMLSSVSGSPTSGGYYEAGTRRGEHHQEPFQLYSILSSPSWSFQLFIQLTHSPISFLPQLAFWLFTLWLTHSLTDWLKIIIILCPNTFVRTATEGCWGFEHRQMANQLIATYQLEFDRKAPKNYHKKHSICFRYPDENRNLMLTQILQRNTRELLYTKEHKLNLNCRIIRLIGQTVVLIRLLNKRENAKVSPKAL